MKMRLTILAACASALALAQVDVTRADPTYRRGALWDAGGDLMTKNKTVTPKGEKTDAIKSSKSTTSNRMGGGGGKGVASAPAKTIKLNSSRSN